MDRDQKRLDLATEAVKQQITLATAIIGATLAFSEKVTGATQDLLALVFAPLVLSVISGVLTLMSISYHLKGSGDPLSPWRVRILGVTQNLGFLLAIVLMWYVIAFA